MGLPFATQPPAKFRPRGVLANMDAEVADGWYYVAIGSTSNAPEGLYSGDVGLFQQETQMSGSNGTRVQRFTAHNASTARLREFVRFGWYTGGSWNYGAWNGERMGYSNLTLTDYWKDTGDYALYRYVNGRVDVMARVTSNASTANLTGIGALPAALAPDRYLYFPATNRPSTDTAVRVVVTDGGTIEIDDSVIPLSEPLCFAFSFKPAYW